MIIGPDIPKSYPVRGRRVVAETLALACAFLADALIVGCGQGEEAEAPAARSAVAQPAVNPVPRAIPAPYTPDPLRSAAIEILVGAHSDGHRRVGNPHAISASPSIRHSCAPGGAFAHPNASRNDPHADAHRNTPSIADTDAHRHDGIVAYAHRHGGTIAYAHRHADTIAYAHRHADTFRPARCSDSVYIL